MYSLDNIIQQNNFNLKDIGIVIKNKREELNMTQRDFAYAIGLTENGDRTVRRWENGETYPSLLEINSIVNLKVDVPFPNPKKYDYEMIDLFAGIGGTRLGFQLHGNVKTVFSSEWDKFAQKTYSTNFGERPYGDITKINEQEIPDHDILVGGFPCQAFSQAGLKKGFDDTRGTLFFDVARILKAKRPRMFLLENVKNLVSHDKGKTFDVILKTLQDLDYKVYYKVLRACDYGVPQNRERIYIVGFNKNDYKESLDFSFPEPTYEPTRVGDILDSDVDEKYTISDKLWSGHKRRKKEHIAKGNGFGYTLFDQDSKYTNTISARYYKDGSEILIDQGNKNPRKLTPREASRLQGFPDEFIIPVSDTQAYKQFGNSVVVPVIYKIANQMFSTDHMYKN